MKKYLLLLFITLFSNQGFGFSEDIYSKYPTSIKKKYCLALTKYFNDSSERINDNYYGIGVKRPDPKKWKLHRIKEPGFFNTKLRMWYAQTTKEKYEDFQHIAACIWDGKKFTFEIKHFEYGQVFVCGRYLGPTIIVDNNDCPNLLGF